MKHLLKNSGDIRLAAGGEDQKGYCDRKALLVYSGDFDSMEGLVTITPDDIMKLAQNHNENLTRLAGSSDGEAPVGKCPPIQLDHSQSAKDTVGRVLGKVNIGTYTRDDGIVVPALFCDKLRFLGEENVVKVKDGRWSELSLGADLEDHAITEITVTPFPAAVGSALLKQGAKMNRKKMMKYLMEEKEMSEGEAKEHIKACGEDKTKMKKLMEDSDKFCEKEAKMAGDDDDDAKLSNAEDLPESPEGKANLDHTNENGANLTGDDDDDAHLTEEEKEAAKLKAEDEEEEAALSNAEELPENEVGSTYSVPGANLMANMKNAKLKAKAQKFAKLSRNFQVQLAKTQITNKLARLRSQGKITPAEIKKMDVVKLARSGHADAVLSSYENREPQIHSGVYGTTKAINLSQIHKDFEKASLENETRKNMSLKRNSARKESEVTLSQTESMLRAASTTVHGTSYDDICSMIDKGQRGEAKLALKQEFEKLKLTAGASQDSEKEIAALVKGFETIQNEFVNVLQAAANIKE